MKLVRNLRGHLIVKFPKTKKSLGLMLTMAMIFSMLLCQTAFASQPTPAPIDFSPITNALTGSINVAQVAAIIGIILASSVGIYVFWWGARKLVRAVITAFSKGKIKF